MASGSVRLVCNTDSDEFLVHWPNGSVQFLGFWATCKLLWWIASNGVKLVIVDGKTGEETET